jgi:hypothetical protein
MLRTLANGKASLILCAMINCSYYLELSDDIRGERLRFVEAMKEATAINVQSKLHHYYLVLNHQVMLNVQSMSKSSRKNLREKS